MKKKIKKRSPLRDKPLRYAGQSLDDEIDDKRTDVFTYIMYITMFVAFAAIKWWESFFPSQSALNSALFLTLFALLIGGYFGYKTYRTLNQIELLRMARDGERIVGEELQKLLIKGATVLNDIQGEKFNIDHVVISPHGIYLVETKTHSKPLKKDSKITFDEENIFTDGVKNSRNPITQVKALTNWLQNLLQESTGKKFPIRPVILFPGWFVEKMKKGQSVWILNPKALPIFIENEPIILKDSEVYLITFHLSRYIRTYNPK